MRQRADGFRIGPADGDVVIIDGGIDVHRRIRNLDPYDQGHGIAGLGIRIDRMDVIGILPVPQIGIAVAELQRISDVSDHSAVAEDLEAGQVFDLAYLPPAQVHSAAIDYCLEVRRWLGDSDSEHCGITPCRFSGVIDG